MDSARAGNRHRVRQVTAVLAGIGVMATGAVAGLAHASDRVAGSSTSTSAARSTTSAASSPSVASSSPVQPGIAAGPPQAQSGGS